MSINSVNLQIIKNDIIKVGEKYSILMPSGIKHYIEILSVEHDKFICRNIISKGVYCYNYISEIKIIRKLDW